MRPEKTPLGLICVSTVLFSAFVFLTSPSPGASPSGTLETCASARTAIVNGLSRLRFDLWMSRVEADSSFYVPLVWASEAASGGDRRGLPGTFPAPGWLGMPGSGRVVVWAGHEGAWGPSADGLADNDAFRERILAWLLDGGARVGFTAAHREWMQPAGFSPVLLAWLAARGAGVSRIAGSCDASTLGSFDLVILGNPWGELSDAELSALDSYARGGGSLLVLGLGWSWASYNDDESGDRYPVNRLGERLGFRVMGGMINDPSAPGGSTDQPQYAVRPLSEFRTREVVVLRASETDVNGVKTRAAAYPEALFVIEGSRMALQLPTPDWASLNDPAAALASLERLYAAELALTGGQHAPFDGETIWIVAEDEPDTGWWMASGNPILYRPAASRSEIVPRLNSEGQPGWGVAHEQGHNMVSQSCGSLFQADGTGEVWCNIFTLWSYRQNGWDWRAQMGARLLDVGHRYHAQATPRFSELLADPFILLGCLDLILTRYGWDGMQRFMTTAATDAAAGMTAGDNAAKVAYFVERLSAAYRINFAPLIAHWGFALSDASRAAAAAYPRCDIAW